MVLFKILVFAFIFHDCVSFSFSKKDNTERNITSSLKCENDSPLLVYSRAVGKNDTLHYLMTSFELPTLLALRTESNVVCDVNCSLIFSKNISDNILNCSSKVLYGYSLTLTKLYEYNDAEDTADLNSKPVQKQDAKNWNIIDLSTLVYNNMSHESNLVKHSFSWVVSESNDTNLHLYDGGALSFNVELYSHVGRNEKLPHLLYNGNNSHVFVTLDKLKPKFLNSRFALAMVFATYKKQHPDNFTSQRGKFLDDEHTPGVFDTLQWHPENKEALKAYLQWKPVCYLSPKPSITKSTVVKNYDAIKRELGADPYTLASAIFGPDVHVSATNVSFGLSKDKFYNAALYTEWTFTFGYGSPPEDEVSGLIIAIICVGLGIPLLLMVVGGIYACIRNRQRNRPSEFNTSGYTIIQ